ncbi:hypothetical protein Y032_0011g1356 [Ancylostoma ceylanicum]|uniref:Uncharacterized protein n=1 Tax=Ancylostoma ceylanicum TaxID=53326 RepID=A0A016VEK6_9BILA|nr:hypothetical protein Y032_0011g1356 [Ancylostoma ceylanicum]
MDPIYDTEVVFTDSFASKPVRTFVVNTNAPLHSINANVEPSSGVCTFPPESQFPDRFILWRAVGQKLFLEERSLCRTITEGTLCLDFSRTTILPGTSIALFDQNILCIVVPTQSTVHRFYARLIYDPTEMVTKEVPSIFTQIIEKDFLVDNHTLYQLTTTGHAFRASVIHESDFTKIAYCMTEGQLVVVTLHANKYDKPEEVIFREYGLMKRLLGEATTGGVSDVSGLAGVRSAQGQPEDMFYAVYRDGTLRAWNAENQKVRSIDLCKFDVTVDYEESYLKTLFVKAYQLDSHAVMVVAISTTKNTQFHFISDRYHKLTHLFSVVADNDETLLDFGITHRNVGSRSLWALWNSMSTINEYIVKHVDIDMFFRSPGHVGTWRKVRPYTIRDAVSSTMSAAELRDSVFNADSHPFDIVFRSVQIVCQGSRCECAHGDWMALAAHVDSYLRSPEFDSNYVHRGGRPITSSSVDAHKEAEQRFFHSLGCSCDQLEQAARGPIGLFLLDVVGSSLAGVVQQDRFSVVLPGEMDLVDELESCTAGVMEKIISVALERAEAKEEDELGVDEYETLNGPAHNCTPMRSQVVVKKWSTIIDSFLDIVKSSPVPTGEQSDNMFDGSFTCGLIASRLRHVVKQRYDIARCLLALVQLYAEDSMGFEYPIFDFSDLETKLKNTMNLYKLFDAQLSLKLARDSVQVSLCSWFMEGEGVNWICKAAHVGLPEEDSGRPEFNEFLDMIVNAALDVLSPYSTEALLARSLAVHERYSTLVNLCALYANATPEELRPVVTFYNAIAYSGIGKPLKAMTHFNLAAKGVTDGNKALLVALSPIGQPSQEVNVGDYYVTALRYLHEHRHSEEVVEMARSAVASLPPGNECTSRIYVTLFNHLVNQGNWCDALQSIIQNTDQEIKRMTLRELMSRMLHARDWKSIVELSYGKLGEEVENILLTAARTQEATATPHLFKLIFSFYMKRSDFESAARAQYEYAFVLRTQAEQTPDLLLRRRDALAVASTLLDLLPEQDRFLSFPHELVEEVDGDEAMDSSADITQEMIDVAMGDVIADELNMEVPKRTAVRKRMFILTAEKLCEEWVVANARVALLSTGKVPSTEPKEIVDSLIEIKNYDVAFDVCRHCDVSICDVLYAVTREAIMVDADPPDAPPAWVQLNQRRAEKQGSRSHWAVVRGLLAAAQRLWPDDSRPLRAITRAFLSHNVPVPCWLDAEYTERDVGGYLRCLIEYGAVTQGLKVAANCVEEETKKVKSIESRVWLPTAAINDLLNLGMKCNETALLSALNDKLRAHFTRVDGFEKVARLSQ